jgi:hypothetical protein
VQFHRDQAGTPLYYRSGAPGPAVAEAVGASDRLLDDLMPRLQPPQPVRGHPHWLAALAPWRSEREERGQPEDPPELCAGPPEPAPSNSSAVRHLARSALVGRPHRRNAFHPRWRLSSAISQRIQALSSIGPTLFLQRALMSEFATLADTPAAQGGRPRSVWICLNPRLREPADVLEPVRPVLASAEDVTVLLLCERDQQVADSDLAYLFGWLSAEMDVLKVRAYDFQFDEWARHVHGRLADRFGRVGVSGKMILVLASAAAAAAMLAVNLARLLAPAPNHTRHISALLVTAARRSGGSAAGVATFDQLANNAPKKIAPEARLVVAGYGETG